MVVRVIYARAGGRARTVGTWPPNAMTRVSMILASGSPARLQTLRLAGVEPSVVVPGVDESAATARDAAALALELAEMKGRAVARDVSPHDGSDRTVLVAGDSVLEFAGTTYGKPESPQEAVARWRLMRGGSGTLHTGQFVLDVADGRTVLRGAATTVHFGSPSDEEITAYVDSGEPLKVAGAFTIDGLGGVFVDGVEGDPHTVVGLSLPLLRRMLLELDIRWTDLW